MEIRWNGWLMVTDDEYDDGGDGDGDSNGDDGK